jgi:hypothetical protein
MSISKKPFVYGGFRWPQRKAGLPPPPWMDTFALEILREYSATEFLGKLYSREGSPSTWYPLPPDKVSDYRWYVWFSKMHKFLAFRMEGSSVPWEVLHFRNESDETGLYVAVALRLMTGQTPPWTED